MSTDWQIIFMLSKANGADNAQEMLPVAPRQWPEGWLTKRRRELKEKQADEQTEAH